MIPSSIFCLALALLTSSPFTKAQSDNVTCTSNPAGWALSCLQSSVTGCSSSDTSCLCSSLSSNGNFEIFDDKCLSDGCFNNPQPSGTTPAQVTAAYSSAVAAQSSMGNEEVARVLLDCGANLNVTSAGNIAEALLECNGDMTAIWGCWDTTLAAASRQIYDEIIRWPLSNRVDSEVRLA
ncbi:hypothetical protein FIBSPDRAFT_955018 [Athelia psychrophila]|uniref:Extracellular membrane protein CFEM domain-containing protein n=1 Tax=Athelia psychrophila TaxID=1759441 RepID=A0A166ILR6_9AGAM|nr:hypothetical protein FIBSPDRAFT_955018 [Fibularhizoctonia sp. CBS 109695]